MLWGAVLRSGKAATIVIKEMGLKGVDWIHLAEDGVQWLDLVKKVRKLYAARSEAWALSACTQDRRF
jgi:hypothetical protein